MGAEVYAFGEVLWDLLPSGRQIGGAPFNVCAHLAQLGMSAALVSAVGQDPLGDEILRVAGDMHVDTRFVGRARKGLPTGKVLVEIDQNSNATYELVQPAAWDEIQVPPEALQASRQSRALIYGCVACRSPHNFAQLSRLLHVEGPLKLFDVNLRPPFADPRLVLELAGHADVLKLNAEELGVLSAWLGTGGTTGDTPLRVRDVARSSALLAKATNVFRVCVTRGAQGAVYWDQGEVTQVPAPVAEVRDTVGAGDAFMAGLCWGLVQALPLRHMLEGACRLGTFVATHHGATPPLSPEILQFFQAR